jgi:hypothetical protein
LVILLGNEAVWWSNDTDAGSWNPVTGRAFDGVTAGAGATRFVVVPQAKTDRENATTNHRPGCAPTGVTAIWSSKSAAVQR